MTHKLQVEITKFLIGYYSLIQLTCNEAMVSLGISVEKNVNAKNVNANTNVKTVNTKNTSGNANDKNGNNNSTITREQRDVIISKAREQFVKIRDNYKKLAHGNVNKKKALKNKIMTIIQKMDELHIL